MSMLAKYGISGSIGLMLNLLRTRLFYRPARIIRFPFEIRNRRHIVFGPGFTTGRYCRLETHPEHAGQGPVLKIGSNFQMNDSVHIVAGKCVTIGNNVLLASKIFITDLNHGSYNGEMQDHPDSVPKDRPLRCSPVLIEDNVWVGEFVSILPGVTIGKGAIIGTMSVVTKSIPPYCIAVGSPARVIKKYNFNTNKWEKHTEHE